MRYFAFLCLVISTHFLVSCTPGISKKPPSNVFYDGADSVYGRYLASKYAYVNGHYEKASEFMAQALELEPNDEGLLHSGYASFAAKGYMEKASAIARKAIEGGKGNEFAHVLVLLDLIHKANYKEALDKLTKNESDLTVLESILPVLKLWLKVGLKEELPVDEVIAMANTMTEPQTYFYHLGLVYEFLEQPKKAEDYYRRALMPMDGLSFRLIEMIGGFFERIGNQDQAKLIYEKASLREDEFFLYDDFLARVNKKQKPRLDIRVVKDGIAEVFAQFASAFMVMNLTDTALLMVRSSLYLRPDFHLSQMILASILEQKGSDEDALQEYKIITHESPFYYLGQMNQAKILVRQKKPKEALTLLKLLAQSKPKWAAPHAVAGDILREEKNYKEAIASYTKAIEFQEKSLKKITLWHTYFLRGITADKHKDWNTAEKDLQKSIELNGSYAYALNYLGFSWIDKGLHPDKGMELIQKAVSLAPNEGAIIDSLGWAYFKLGKIDMAKEFLERAIVLSPADAQIHDHLGDLYQALGRKQEAIYSWRKSLFFDPMEEDAAKTKQKLAQEK